MFYDSVVLTFFSCLAHKICRCIFGSLSSRLNLFRFSFFLLAVTFDIFLFKYPNCFVPFSLGLEMQMNNDESYWMGIIFNRPAHLRSGRQQSEVMIRDAGKQCEVYVSSSSKCPVYPGCFLRRTTRPFHSPHRKVRRQKNFYRQK